MMDREEENKAFIGALGVILVLILLCSSCQTVRYVPVEKTETVTEIRHDTAVVIRLQEFRDTVIVPADPVNAEAESHLRNRYATSDAVYKEGELWHTLNMLPVPADTVTITDYKEVIVTKKEPEIVPVEKPESLLQLLMKIFSGMFFGFLIGICTHKDS